MPTRYIVAEATDLMTKTKTYKIYEQPGGLRDPVAIGFSSREEAEAKRLELEREAESKP